MASQIVKRGIQTATANLANPGTAASAGHGGGYKLWKRLSFFVAIPAVGVCMLNTYLEHQKEHADGHHRPPFVAYDYLRVRNKRFPWGEGNKSLFHNPHVNPLPDGYEEEH